MYPSKDIVDNAVNSADHRTLVAALQREIVKQGGKAKLATAGGGSLSFTMNGNRNIQVMDEAGHTASISTYDVAQANGVINAIDTVLMPQ